MIRKLVLALGATTAIAAAALTPTTASAWGGHHGHRGHGFGFGIYAPVLVDASSCYYVNQKVMTPFGWQIQKVQVCD